MCSINRIGFILSELGKNFFCSFTTPQWNVSFTHRPTCVLYKNCFWNYFHKLLDLLLFYDILVTLKLKRKAHYKCAVDAWWMHGGCVVDARRMRVD